MVTLPSTPVFILISGGTETQPTFRLNVFRRFVPPKLRLIFNGLHGVIFQKTELFLTTAVRASESACLWINSWVKMLWLQLVVMNFGVP
jgi:hypothetical protein